MKYKNYKEELNNKNKTIINHYHNYYKVLNNFQRIIINYMIKNILMQKLLKIFKIVYKEVYNKIIKKDSFNLLKITKAVYYYHQWPY